MKKFDNLSRLARQNNKLHGIYLIVEYIGAVYVHYIRIYIIYIYIYIRIYIYNVHTYIYFPA